MSIQCDIHNSVYFIKEYSIFYAVIIEHCTQNRSKMSIIHGTVSFLQIRCIRRNAVSSIPLWQAQCCAGLRATLEPSVDGLFSRGSVVTYTELVLSGELHCGACRTLCQWIRP